MDGLCSIQYSKAFLISSPPLLKIKPNVGKKTDESTPGRGKHREIFQVLEASLGLTHSRARVF
jgi:hypothetical protein